MQPFFPRTLSFVLIVGLAACSQTEAADVDVGAERRSTPMLWLAANPDSQSWEASVTSAIDEYGSSLLSSTPDDIADWCPTYGQHSDEERKAFWSYLMSSLMRYESNYDPSVTYTEPFNDASGNRVVSRGPLQLSIESANGYGCGISDPRELHDPQTNLSCSVRIMNRWIERDSVIQSRTATGNWRGLARYWSPFRRSSQRSAMQAQVRASSYCKM